MHRAIASWYLRCCVADEITVGPPPATRWAASGNAALPASPLDARPGEAEGGDVVPPVSPDEQADSATTSGTTLRRAASRRTGRGARGAGVTSRTGADRREDGVKKPCPSASRRGLHRFFAPGCQDREVGSRILVADDDSKLTSLVRTYLERAGHSVAVVHDGRAALAECRRRLPDLTILDVMMPVLDGHDVCHVLRSEGETPIIFLTARTTEDDLVSGLALGADDYITKPFSPRELVARVDAVLRRTRPATGSSELRAGTLVLDEARHTVTLAARPVDGPPA